MYLCMMDVYVYRGCEYDICVCIWGLSTNFICGTFVWSVCVPNAQASSSLPVCLMHKRVCVHVCDMPVYMYVLYIRIYPRLWPVCLMPASFKCGSSV